MRWTESKAWEWHQAQPWRCGFNILPSSAVNATEMWQAETFDEAMITRDLGWGRDLGFNACRVFLPFLVWDADPDAFRGRFDRFLALASAAGFATLPILFDDCAFAGKEPYLGPQDPPVPGVHNSGWTPSPGLARVTDRAAWPGLQAYVTDLVSAFREDPRVMAWDLYNEPGNSGMGYQSLPLLETVFVWARATSPTQPLTVGEWTPDLPALNAVSRRESDVVSFHSYTDRPALEAEIEALKREGRPLLCTEWMRRPLSRWEENLPLFRDAGVHCFAWGLVTGRTQTRFPWGSSPGAPEPDVWFHDLLHEDGSPWDADEVEGIRRILSGFSTT